MYLKHIAIILHAAKLANDLLCCFAKFREIYYTVWPFRTSCSNEELFIIAIEFDELNGVN